MTATANPAADTSDQDVTQSASEGGSPERDLGVDDIDERLLEDLDTGEDDAPVAEDDAGADDAESSDDAEDEEKAPDPSVEYREQIEDLKAEIAQRDEILQALRDRMDRDPAFRKMLEGGRGSEPEEADPVTRFKTTIRERLTPEAAEALEDALTPVLKHMTELEKELAGVKPNLQRLTRKIGSTEFQEALAEGGISAGDMRSAGFQKHLKRLRGQSEFQRLESRSPTFAAEFAASKWLARQNQRSGNRDERARIESAKRGRGVSPQHSSRGAEKVIRITRDSVGGHLDKAAAIRLKAEREGRPMPRIEYVND